MQAQMQRIRAALPESALQEELLGWEDDLEAAATPAQLKSLLGSLEAGLAEEWAVHALFTHAKACGPGLACPR